MSDNNIPFNADRIREVSDKEVIVEEPRDGPAPTIIGDNDGINSNDIKLETIENKDVKLDPDIECDGDSDISVPPNEYYDDQQELHHQMFDSETARRKEGYNRVFDQYRSQGRKVEHLSDDDDISAYRNVYDRLINEVSQEGKYALYNNIIWIITWTIERLLSQTKKGNVDGWSDQVWAQKNDYRIYFDEMTRPIPMKDSKTGQIVMIDNPSVINKVSKYMRPEINLTIAIGRSFISYYTLKNLKTFTERITTNEDTHVNEDDFENLDI